MDVIESALGHIRKELMLPEIRTSLELDFEKARKAHDAIHMFMLLASKLVPWHATGYSFHRNSAYLVYHWEIFDLAHRSSLEALSTFYNASFILLRATLELIINGSLFECLSHREYREISSLLDDDANGCRLKSFIDNVIKNNPTVGNDLEIISAAIYDVIEPIASDPNYSPSVSKKLRQLTEWGIFDGVPNAFDLIYGMYGKLSQNVHVLPDYTDIGRVMLSEEIPFGERKVMPSYLSEYHELLFTTIDVGMVVTLNILGQNIKNFKEIRDHLASILDDGRFISLDLKHTPNRIVELLQK